MNPLVRIIINALSSGTIMIKTVEDALDLFEEMVTTQHMWSNEGAFNNKSGLLEEDGLQIVIAKLDALSKTIYKMSVKKVDLLLQNVNYAKIDTLLLSTI